MKILIGNTGLIGKNLKDQQEFDYEFNSKNINELDQCPDNCDLYLSCLPATKWYINQNIEQDLNNILNIFFHISKKKYRKVYLFSTVDVYCNSPLHVNEIILQTFPILIMEVIDFYLKILSDNLLIMKIFTFLD